MLLEFRRAFLIAESIINYDGVRITLETLSKRIVVTQLDVFEAFAILRNILVLGQRNGIFRIVEVQVNA